MSRVKIVTDSSSGVPQEVIEKNGIEIVPIQVQFGTDSYKEGRDLTIDEFYRRLDEPVLPTTSQPAPGDFVQMYKGLVGECDEIISVHLTSKGSGTCQAARLASQMIEGARITIVDTQTASLGTGLIAMAAAEAALGGGGHEEVMRVIRRAMDTTSVFVALPTLKYLRRSGRVPQVQAWVASLLSINPILGVRDGMVEAVERVRTFRGAVRRTVELAARACGGRASRIVIMHTNALDDARALLEDARQMIQFDEVHFAEMGGSMAVHGGAGMLGIAVTQA